MYQNVSSTSALGTKLVLTDRKGGELGSLIVGLKVKNVDENQLEQRFARIPGQPHVYVINYVGEILTTAKGFASQTENVPRSVVNRVVDRWRN